MTNKNTILQVVEECNIELYRLPLKGNTKGLYADNVMAISNQVDTEAEFVCVVAEELGHHNTTYGNILDLKSIANQKQELKARQWAYEHLVDFNSLIKAYEANISGYELADFLGVSDDFLHDSINRYRDKYGMCAKVGDYIIYFDPLGVMKIL